MVIYRYDFCCVNEVLQRKYVENASEKGMRDRASLEEGPAFKSRMTAYICVESVSNLKTETGAKKQSEQVKREQTVKSPSERKQR